jgi:hypothetical protein
MKDYRLMKTYRIRLHYKSGYFLCLESSSIKDAINKVIRINKESGLDAFCIYEKHNITNIILQKGYEL